MCCGGKNTSCCLPYSPQTTAGLIGPDLRDPIPKYLWPLKKHEAKKLTPEEALDLVCGPRMEFYGPPKENLQDIADTWTPYVKRALKLRDELTGTDVATLMVMLKCMRQVRGYHRDSTVDISGYSTLMEILNEPDSFAVFVKRAAEKIENEEERLVFIERFLKKESNDDSSLC